MLRIDASEYERAAANLMKLPPRIKAKAFARASRAVAKDMRRAVVRRSAERIDIAQKWVNQAYVPLNAGSGTIEAVVRSGWIPLIKLGAKPGKRGARVPGRRQVRGSFIATMASGHVGVFRRMGARDARGRERIRELFGPNPASDILNNPGTFEETLLEVAEDRMLPRLVKAVRDELWKAMH